MSNVIRFPSASQEGTATAQLLTEPPPHTHAVQFYEEVEALVETVAKFSSAGLAAGECVLIIATEDHREGFLRRLDRSMVAKAVATGELTFLDARETLARFMVGGMPDPDLFRDMLGRVLSSIRADTRKVRIRAFGEMVDLLSRDGNTEGAIRLEELWNAAGTEHSFALLCAYVIGTFYRDGDGARFTEICRHHSHVIPTESFATLDDADARSREISLLQLRAKVLEREIEHRRELEAKLHDALRERNRVEEELRASVRREKAARTRAEESDAFKEEFLGMLGHDLRNPLNTILTTARLMVMRGEVRAESQKRIERVITSGARMQRMIDQILDVTRARLGSGIPVACSPPQDLVALVSKIVEEIRLEHPARQIELQATAPCFASVDADRLEQVVSNLVGNAVTHGDPEQPVRITVLTTNDRLAVIEVENQGPAIDPEPLSLLFDPFKRARKSVGRSAGLGLGLYISERIVSAHGGQIEVESSAEEGTRFRAVLPRDPR